MVRSLAAEHIPWHRKLGYGSAELGIVAVEVLVELYVLKFYNVTVGLPPQWAGLAIAIAIVWDAISDPIMGELSDRTHTRTGRRRPYLIPGAVALAGSFILIFNPPAMASTVAKFLYLAGSYLCLTTAMTVLSVPHIALGGEMSFDRHERTQIFGYRRLYTTVGFILGTMLPALVIKTMTGEATPEDVEASRSLTSYFMAVPIVLTAWITVLSTRGLDRTEARSVHRAHFGLRVLLRSQWGVVRNLVFLPLLGAFVVASLGRTMNASLAMYYYEYRLGLSESETILKILAPFGTAALASIPFWIMASKRWGKQRPALVGVFGLGTFVGCAYVILQPGQVHGAIFAAIAGGIFGGALVLLESMVADIVDHDELKTGQHREGLYFGVWKMGTKLARAAGLALAGFLLQTIGFDEGAGTQSDSVSQGLALLFGPGVGGFLVLGGFILLANPLTDQRHERVQQLLLRRRRMRGERNNNA